MRAAGRGVFKVPQVWLGEFCYWGVRGEAKKVLV